MGGLKSKIDGFSPPSFLLPLGVVDLLLNTPLFIVLLTLITFPSIALMTLHSMLSKWDCRCRRPLHKIRC